MVLSIKLRFVRGPAEGFLDDTAYSSGSAAQHFSFTSSTEGGVYQRSLLKCFAIDKSIRQFQEKLVHAGRQDRQVKP